MDLIWPGAYFFESVPAGGDAYLLSRVIHDWDDDRALRILDNCRRAIEPRGRLLIVDGVSKPPNEPDPNKFLDVWFIGGGGGERTEAEWRALLGRAGLPSPGSCPSASPSPFSTAARTDSTASGRGQSSERRNPSRAVTTWAGASRVTW
jgi:hypothetical protein